MPPSPVFSMISVTLNNLEGLQKTKASLQEQSFSDYEWLVIDGDSEDGTPIWLETTKAHWISEPDRGIYDAMNKGLNMAKGEYVLFLNAGDYLADTDIGKIHNEIQQQDPAPEFVYGDSYEILKDGQRVYKPARSHEKIAGGMFTHHQAMFYRRKTLGELRYDTGYKIAADYDFTCRFLQQIKSALYLPFPVCVFESGGISQQNARQGRREEFQIRRDLYMTSFLGNVWIYLRQSLAMTFRRKLPSLFWFIRSKKNKFYLK